MKREWLSALGILFIVLGGTVDLLDQLGGIDIRPLLPVDNADAILAGIGVAKLLLRAAYAIVAFFVARNKESEKKEDPNG